MDHLFSSAKLAPPPFMTALVDRSRLLDAIDRERHRRLLVVQAMAGSGKTVLLAQWRRRVQAGGARVAWIGFGREDAVPGRMLAGIAAALRRAGVELPDPHGHPGEMAPADFLDILLAQGERTARETWIILDDWHLMQSDANVAWLEMLLRCMPANWHVALASRVRPRLGLAALRARGELSSLDGNDLRFRPEEADALLAPDEVSATDVAALVGMTEGWAIALQLARLRLADTGTLAPLQAAFVESIDGLADYLAGEVLGDLPPDLRDFLVEASACPHFSADLADAALGRSDTASLIEMLRSRFGLLVALDDRRQWYRLPRVLALFLAGERAHLPVERRAQFHVRAADWLAGHGLLFDAVEQARLSGDQTRMVELVENAGCIDICIHTGAPPVRALLDSLPPDIVGQRPRLRAARTAMTLKQGSIAEAEQALSDLRRLLRDGTTDAALARDLLVVERLRLCFIDTNPTAEDLATQRRMLEKVSGEDWWQRGLLYNVLGRLDMRAGRLNEAVQSLDCAERIFDEGGSAQGRFFMRAHLAICHLFLGRLTMAEQRLNQGRAVLESQMDVGNPGYLGIAHTVEALLLYERNELAAAGYAAELGLSGLEMSEGCFEQYFISIHVAANVAAAATGLDAAMRVLDRGQNLARYHGLTRMDGLLDCLRARLMIDGGQVDAARALVLRSPGLAWPPPDNGWMEQDFAAPVHCLLALADGQAELAMAIAQTMRDRCRAAGRVPAQIRALILIAYAGLAHGDRAGTDQSLRQAVELATEEGIAQPFFEFDARLLRLLRDLQRSELVNLPSPQANFLSGLVLRIIATGKAKATANVEQLTAREWEILIHLRQGVSNKVIARSLDLTEHAVKFHLKNIFRKLGVDSRAMAAAVASRLPQS